MIDQAIVYGDYKPYLVALIILNQEFEFEKESLEEEIENIDRSFILWPSHNHDISTYR